MPRQHYYHFAFSNCNAESLGPSNCPPVVKYGLQNCSRRAQLIAFCTRFCQGNWNSFSSLKFYTVYDSVKFTTVFHFFLPLCRIGREFYLLGPQTTSFLAMGQMFQKFAKHFSFGPTTYTILSILLDTQENCSSGGSRCSVVVVDTEMMYTLILMCT